VAIASQQGCLVVNHAHDGKVSSSLRCYAAPDSPDGGVVLCRGHRITVVCQSAQLPLLLLHLVRPPPLTGTLSLSHTLLRALCRHDGQTSCADRRWRSSFSRSRAFACKDSAVISDAAGHTSKVLDTMQDPWADSDPMPSFGGGAM
jgi:hypothetical protein